MKLADFDFRLVLTPQIMLDIACDNKDCPCQTPLLYDEQARNHFNDPLYKDCELELWSGYTDSKGTKIYEGDIVCCYFAMNGLIIFENAMFYVLNQHSGEKKTLFEALHESQAEKEPFVVESNIHFEFENNNEAKRLHNQRLCRSLRR